MHRITPEDLPPVLPNPRLATAVKLTSPPENRASSKLTLAAGEPGAIEVDQADAGLGAAS